MSYSSPSPRNTWNTSTWTSNRRAALNTFCAKQTNSTIGKFTGRNLSHARNCTLILNRTELCLEEVRFPDALLRRIRVQKEWMPTDLPKHQASRWTPELALHKQEFWNWIMMGIWRREWNLEIKLVLALLHCFLKVLFTNEAPGAHCIRAHIDLNELLASVWSHEFCTPTVFGSKDSNRSVMGI